MSAVAHPGSSVFGTARPDPLARVLELGERELRFGFAVGVIGAAMLHGVAVYQMATNLFDMELFARGVRGVVLERQRAEIDIDLHEPEPPKPPPAPEEIVKEEPAPTPPVDKQQAEKDQPPPEAAQAGKLLTQEPSPDDPLDLTKDGFVTGDSDRFAGGTTASAGTSKTAVNDTKARNGGAPGGKGTKPGAPAGPAPTAAKDGSRPAAPTSRSWNCGFPPEADFDQIDYATVMISVTVGTDGRAKSVNVLNDPGHGFGRLAKSCALRMQYTAGIDKDGQPVTKTTSPFPVRFTR
ncbi:MAG: energy transducer TonB [Myxococcales bacterium]|nr:energy transducer TonB [Myxococcales bacterium]